MAAFNATNIIGKDRKNKLITIGLKVFLPLAALSYLVYKIFRGPSVSLSRIDEYLVFENTHLLGVILILSFVNWYIEAFKWKMVVKGYQPFTLIEAYKAVLAGLSISALLPFRVGEYIGRLTAIKNNRIKISILNMLSGLTQLTWTVIFGLIILLMNLEKLWKFMAFSQSEILKYVAFIIVVSGVVIAFLYHKKNWLRLIRISAQSLSTIKKGHVIYSLWGLSGLRYLVFIIQFYLCFQVVNIDISLMHTFQIIGLMFFLMAFLPINQIVELGATRALMIIFLFGALGIDMEIADKIGITFIGFFIWLVNIAIPSLLGTYFLYQLRSID